MINLNREQIFQVVVIVLLLVSLPLSIYLLSKPMLFKTKAAEEVYNAFEIRDADGSLVTCSESGCDTSSTDVNVKLIEIAFFNHQQE